MHELGSIYKHISAPVFICKDFIRLCHMRYSVSETCFEERSMKT